MENQKKGQILIVEDNRDIAFGAALRLHSAGYQPTVAQDASEAWQKISCGQPDAIVLDVVMPGISGLEFMGQLRHTISTQSIPVVMLSASLRDKQAALDAGARFFLPKPYSAEHLLAAIDVAIREQKSNSENNYC